ncbi:hypothetical protein HY498_05925 [Candidatus Woesearchaeota archaeon]|nr:hypothetical protein [Candidatus Woesearchaeota archaeon]
MEEKRFIFILALVSIFVVASHFLKLETTTTSAVMEKYTIEVTSSSCDLTEEGYNTCVNVKWDAPEGYYVKVFIPGGESLSETPKFYTKEFTYCQQTDKDLIKRIANIYLHNEKGKWVKFIKGYKIEC